MLREWAVIPLPVRAVDAPHAPREACLIVLLHKTVQICSCGLAKVRRLDFVNWKASEVPDSLISASMRRTDVLIWAGRSLTVGQYLQSSR